MESGRRSSQAGCGQLSSQPCSPELLLPSGSPPSGPGAQPSRSPESRAQGGAPWSLPPRPRDLGPQDPAGGACVQARLHRFAVKRLREVAALGPEAGLQNAFRCVDQVSQVLRTSTPDLVLPRLVASFVKTVSSLVATLFLTTRRRDAVCPDETPSVRVRCRLSG